MNGHGHRFAWVPVLGLLAIGACGEQQGERIAPVSAGPHRTASDGGAADSGSGSSPGTVPRPSGNGIGASPDAAVSRLSDDEVGALCDELDARFRARISDEDAARFACNLSGARSAITNDADGNRVLDRTVCQRVTDQCLTTGTSTGSAVDCAVLSEAVRRCTLQVDMFEACFDAQVERIASAIDQLACDALNTGDELDMVLAGLDASALPECEAIAHECPALLPSGDGVR